MRIAWIDVAKAYGITLVFYGHLLSRLISLGNASAFSQYKLIYAFHMPLFFVLSGYVSKNNELRLRYRLASRIVPFIFFNLLSFGIEIPKDVITHSVNLDSYLFDLLSFIRGYPTFNPPTWFLICLFTVETIDFLLQKYIKSSKRRVILTICLYLFGWLVTWKAGFFSSAIGIEENFWFLHESLVAYLFYWFGQVLNRGKFLETKQPLIAHLAILLFAELFLILTFNLNTGPFVSQRAAIDMAKSSHGNFILFPLTAIAGGIFVIYIAKLTPPCKAILFIGQNTLTLLGINGLFVHFLNQPFAESMNRFLPDTQLAVFGACSLATLVSMILSIPAVLALNRFLPQLVGKPKVSGPVLNNLI